MKCIRNTCNHSFSRNHILLNISIVLIEEGGRWGRRAKGREKKEERRRRKGEEGEESEEGRKREDRQGTLLEIDEGYCRMEEREDVYVHTSYGKNNKK